MGDIITEIPVKNKFDKKKRVCKIKRRSDRV